MPININVQADNGTSVGYHKAVKLVVDLQANTATVTVNSHSTEQAANGGLPIAWQWSVIVPAELLTGSEPTVLAQIEYVLSTDANSPFIGGAIVSDNTLVLATRIPQAIAKTYRDVNKVVLDAVGNLTEEYKDAEVDARAYKAAGYTGDVPENVECFALHNPTGAVQTGQWAADGIIMRADAFAAARKAMRVQRMAAQSAMRAAVTNEQLDQAANVWGGFITQLRTQLGLRS